ncbi:uncharacterized protein [Ptychodera flava]|uniref:uncharacterized protein n=1 Tax=Ptychodera flava TaxID=63121 RepID=UPI00396A906F
MVFDIKKLLFAVALLAGLSSTFAAAVPELRPCTWDDVMKCEKELTTYVHDPVNWDTEKKTVLYCEFMRLRMECIQKLDCDKSNPTEEMPINMTLWANIIESRVNMMQGLDFCSTPAETMSQAFPVSDDPCSTYQGVKMCSEAITDYLMSQYSLTCVAMIKAVYCMGDQREFCGRGAGAADFEATAYYHMAVTGHCNLIYDAEEAQAMKDWRLANSDFFEFF